MTLQEFYTLQEETFDSFCKTLIRNESINAHKEYAFRAQTETPYRISAVMNSNNSLMKIHTTLLPHTLS